MTESKEKLLIDIHELSELTGIASGTLYHWVIEHRVPCVRLSQRCLRFSLTEIRKWIEDFSEPAATDPMKPSATGTAMKAGR